MNDNMKIVKSLEESDLSIKSVSQTIKNKAKEQSGGFLGMLLGALGASLSGNILTVKGEIAMSQRREVNILGQSTIRVGEGTIRAGQDF